MLSQGVSKFGVYYNFEAMIILNVLGISWINIITKYLIKWFETADIFVENKTKVLKLAKLAIYAYGFSTVA